MPSDTRFLDGRVCQTLGQRIISKTIFRWILLTKNKKEVFRVKKSHLDNFLQNLFDQLHRLQWYHLRAYEVILQITKTALSDPIKGKSKLKVWDPFVNHSFVFETAINLTFRQTLSASVSIHWWINLIYLGIGRHKTFPGQDAWNNWIWLVSFTTWTVQVEPHQLLQSIMETLKSLHTPAREVLMTHVAWLMWDWLIPNPISALRCVNRSLIVVIIGRMLWIMILCIEDYSSGGEYIENRIKIL